MSSIERRLVKLEQAPGVSRKVWLWIPMMPPGRSEVKASTCSNLMPSTVLR